MLTIRLRRMGSRNHPYYRVVLSESRKVPTASALEELGHYNPAVKPPEIRINAERVAHWVGLGAQPSATVKKLLAVQESAAS